MRRLCAHAQHQVPSLSLAAQRSGAKGSAGTDCGVVGACVGEASDAPVATHPLDSKRQLRIQPPFRFKLGTQCILRGGPRRA